MPIIDLLNPWVLAEDSPGGVEHFQRQHHQLLESLRRQRAPAAAALEAPLPTVRNMSVARNQTIHATLRRERDKMRDAGWRVPRDVVLLWGGDPGTAYELLPDRDLSTLCLFVDRTKGETLTAALIAGCTTWHRWTAPEPGNAIARLVAQGDWDKWQAMRRTPLAEWIYTEGIAVHAVAERFPDWGAEALLGLGRTELERLRQMERLLRRELDAELDQTGIGLVVRWLVEDAPPALRQRGRGRAIPAGAGRYLAWRMLAQRVGRVGVFEAAGLGV